MKRTTIVLSTLAAVGAVAAAIWFLRPVSPDALEVEFMGMKAPQTPEEMAKTYSAASVRVAGKEYPLSYHALFGVTDRVGSNPHAAGQLYNYKMEPIKDPFGKPIIAETPDANSLLAVGEKLFLITHYEYDWILSNGAEASKAEGWHSRMPMSMTLTELKQANDGKLEAIEQKPLDFSGVNGLWIPCFGSQTPWNTHLGSEEDYDLYFTAASGEKGHKLTQRGLKAMNEIYFKGEKTAKAYHYGYLTEVALDAEGNDTIVKHYGMGRGTWEMGKVMPDQKTVYFGDDGANVGLFMFVADKPADLSAGTLYAAKWNQTSPDGDKNGGNAKLAWIKLGHAADAEVKQWADTLGFNDIFDSAAKAGHDPKKHGNLTAVIAGHSEIEYLKVKPGMERAAAFLETRRYAALQGATTEFNKMEGVAVNDRDKKLYLAISYIDKGMRANPDFATDHVRVAKNNCGGTYELSLQKNQKDQNGEPILGDYVATDMAVPAALLGTEIAPDALGNTCDPDRVANTDNIFFSEKMRTLFIGEDSGTHVNNFVWAYNVDSGKLSRILSVVAGAEATGLQVVEDLNGHAYIMSNAQHQGDFIDTSKPEINEKLKPLIDPFYAPIGYIGGLPGVK